MEVIVLIVLLWAWEGNLWEEVDPEPETPVVEQSVPDNAVDVTQVTQTAAVLTAVAESLTGTSTATSTQTEAQIIEELENMDVTTTTVPTTTTATGTSTSTSTSTGT